VVISTIRTNFNLDLWFCNSYFTWLCWWLIIGGQVWPLLIFAFKTNLMEVITIAISLPLTNKITYENWVIVYEPIFPMINDFELFPKVSSKINSRGDDFRYLLLKSRSSILNKSTWIESLSREKSITSVIHLKWAVNLLIPLCSDQI
jgi:hypothetical protein